MVHKQHAMAKSIYFEGAGLPHNKKIIQLYNTKMLSYTQHRTVVMYHASVYLLQKLDHVQKTSSITLALMQLNALLFLNLTHLSLRWNIAMLGLIHRTVLYHKPTNFKYSFIKNMLQTQRPGDSNVAKKDYMTA